jgi:trans-2-enoyl-CoA reductase
MGNEDPKRWEQQVRDAALRVEEDLRRVVAYINDQVVPEIRLNGSQALRAAAEELQKLAQRMDDRSAAAHGQGPPTAPAPEPDKDKPQS